MGYQHKPELATIFGILGNIVACFVFLAPVPTFYSIYKRKSSAGYPSLPYIIALFSASLLLYYAVLKTNAFLVVTINTIGGAIELTYLLLYIFYAPKRTKIITFCLILVVDIGFLGAIFLFSLKFAEGSKRINLVGWICASINVAVFASPLSVMAKVIRTKSVEFMPIALSFFLTANAVTWFFYGLFDHDYYIAVPNVLGFAFGIVQMILYFIYRKVKPPEKEREDDHIIITTPKSVEPKVEAEKDVEMVI